MPRASISTVLVRPLVHALAPSPRALDAFWAATDLTAERIADTDARVTPAQFCVAWAEALRATRDPTLALRIAEATPQGAFGIVEYVCRSSPTLRDALTQWIRYLGILDDAVEVGLVDVPGGSALRVLIESEAPAPASHELCFALVVKHARAMLSAPLRVSAVHFAHPRESDPARYRSFFDADVRFGAPHTELVLPSSALDAPLLTADPTLLGILLPTADGMRERSVAEPTLTEQVRRALETALRSDDAHVDVVARKLGTTERSLQRRLKLEGTSFQLLRDEVRQRLADRYLGEKLSLAEISFLLGFSEPSAFFRAFKRWTGVTPIERREQLA